MRKRKTTYPPAKTANRNGPASTTPGEPVVRSTVATINLQAVKGRSGLQVGGRVRVLGTGRYAGQIGIIEKLVTGGIPQAIVRTEDAGTGRVRTIDLEPVNEQPRPAAPPPTPQA